MSCKKPRKRPLPPTPQPRVPQTCNLQPSCQRASAPKVRNGKIARLPYLERDMVNRMLRNNINHSRIKNALDEHGYAVTQRNISNWKTRGGYRDWCLEQDRAVQTRLVQDNLIEHLRTSNPSQLPEVGLQLAATELSQFFLKPETRGQLATDPDKFVRAIAILCRLTRQIFNLQRYRDETAKALGKKNDPERIKHDLEEQIELTREIFSAADLGESPNDPIVPHRNYFPRGDRPPPPPEEENDSPPTIPLWQQILKESIKARSKRSSKRKAKKPRQPRNPSAPESKPPSDASPNAKPADDSPASLPKADNLAELSPSSLPKGRGPG